MTNTKTTAQKGGFALGWILLLLNRIGILGEGLFGLTWGELGIRWMILLAVLSIGDQIGALLLKAGSQESLANTFATIRTMLEPLDLWSVPTILNTAEVRGELPEPDALMPDRIATPLRYEVPAAHTVNWLEVLGLYVQQRIVPTIYLLTFVISILIMLW